jgi:hypothetical protein
MINARSVDRVSDLANRVRSGEPAETASATSGSLLAIQKAHAAPHKGLAGGSK